MPLEMVPEGRACAYELFPDSNWASMAARQKTGVQRSQRVPNAERLCSSNSGTRIGVVRVEPLGTLRQSKTMSDQMTSDARLPFKMF
eukprot:6214466-Pleurochrysis_carterae.AAC.6